MIEIKNNSNVDTGASVGEKRADTSSSETFVPEVSTNLSDSPDVESDTSIGSNGSNIVFGWDINSSDIKDQKDADRLTKTDLEPPLEADLICIARELQAAFIEPKGIEESLTNSNSKISTNELHPDLNNSASVTKEIEPESSDDDLDECFISQPMADFADDEVSDASFLKPPRTRNEIEAKVDFIEDEKILIGQPTEMIGSIIAIIQPESSIIVKGIIGKVLEEDGILAVFITEEHASLAQLILGRIQEVFGPITAPHYVVKIDPNRKEIFGKVFIDQEVSRIVSQSEYLIIDKLVSKGCDASNFYDEEIPASDLEFSDDDAENQHKMKQKAGKRQRNREHAEVQKPNYSHGLKMQENGRNAPQLQHMLPHYMPQSQFLPPPPVPPLMSHPIYPVPPFLPYSMQYPPMNYPGNAAFVYQTPYFTGHPNSNVPVQNDSQITTDGASSVNPNTTLGSTPYHHFGLVPPEFKADG